MKQHSTPNGLSTLALLKARFDEGLDYIEIFMPLIQDAIAALPTDDFIVQDLQQELLQIHGITLPQIALQTLLSRAKKLGLVRREAGRFFRLETGLRSTILQDRKVHICSEQVKLANAFLEFAQSKGDRLESPDAALGLLMDFLNENRVGILLDGALGSIRNLSPRQTRLVAEFVGSILDVDSSFSELSEILRGIVEGLVVYNTASLADISSSQNPLRGLKIYLDTHDLLQASGARGEIEKVLARETIQILTGAGARCLYFDVTLKEMQNLLSIYVDRLGSTATVTTLYPNSMTRFFVSNRFTPSDVKEFSTMLPTELSALGVDQVRTPTHIIRFTLDEKKLAEQLSKEHPEDATGPRVTHDVECAASVLTLRGGNSSTSLAHIKEVFATSSARTIEEVKEWFIGQGGTGISPMIHIRSLANIAWLQKPSIATNLKLHELVALCKAALQPSRKTWARFLEHLRKLEQSEAITSEEAVALVVGELTEDFLSDTCEEDVDAATLTEVIERVRAAYRADADSIIFETKKAADAEVAEARRKERRAIETASKLETFLEGRSSSAAKRIAQITSWVVRVLTAVGGLILIFEHPFGSGIWAAIVGGFLIAFLLIEIGFVLAHVGSLAEPLEKWLLPMLRRFYGAERPRETKGLLGLDSEGPQSHSQLNSGSANPGD